MFSHEAFVDSDFACFSRIGLFLFFPPCLFFNFIFFQVSGQGACESGGSGEGGGEKNPSGKGGMQVFLVRKAVCFSISFFFRCLAKVPVKPAELMEVAARRIRVAKAECRFSLCAKPFVFQFLFFFRCLAKVPVKPAELMEVAARRIRVAKAECKFSLCAKPFVFQFLFFSGVWPRCL